MLKKVELPDSLDNSLNTRTVEGQQRNFPEKPDSGIVTAWLK